MSATYSIKPKDIDFCGNGLGFKIAGTNYVIAAGLKGNKIINIPGGIVVGGDWFDFWDFESAALFRINVKSTPPYGDNDIPSLYNTDDIALALATHYKFNKYYTVYGSGDRIYIYTREKRYIQWPTMSALSVNLTVFSQTNGTDPEYRPNYSIFAQLDYYTGSLNFKVAEFKLEPDLEGYSELFVGKLMKSYIAPSLPALASLTVSFFELQKYLLLTGERYEVDDVMQVNRMTGFTGFALNGKLDYGKFPGFDLEQEITEDKIFLNTPGSVEIWKSAHYFLHYYNPLQGIETITIKATIYYTDQSSHTANVLIDNNSYQIGRVFRFPCSIDKLNLESFYPAKEIYKYELWVTHAYTSILCEKKTFLVIEEPMFVKQYAFLNRFGVIENIALVSKTTDKLTTKKILSKYEQQLNYAAADAQLSAEIDEAYNETEVSSGSITKDQAINFQDVLTSEHFFEIENDEYIPCIINEDSFEIITDSEDISIIKFSYRRAFDK